jgi:hypothetical protein
MSSLERRSRHRGGVGLRLGLLAVAVAAWGVPAAASAASGEGPILLRDVSPQTGISFRHSDGSSGRRYIVEYVASGLATFDYDGDGRIDVYFLTGGSLPGAEAEAAPSNRLYRNLGGMRFEDVTERAGVGYAGHGLGVCVGDYDNDLQPDIYLNNFGPNVLYRNQGDGTFRDVTREAGVGRGAKVGAGANFLDIDGDGNLDLFVANYVRFTYDRHVPLTVGGVPAYRGPREYPKDTNNLFHNLGDGTFRDVSRESGIAAYPGSGMGTVCADYDCDGATDIFVGNDVYRNFLFKSDGHGNFSEVGMAGFVSYNVYGQETGSMGADSADFDNDGLPDFFVTTYQNEFPELFRNLGDGLFEDVTLQAGAGRGALNNVKWGCGFVDFDNDGYKDLFFGRGHLDDNIELRDDSTSYEARPLLFRNLGNGKFVNVSQSGGDGMQVKAVARGIAFDDLDNDGRIDVAILSSRRPPVILRNESESGNHWLQIQLRGVKTNRGGVGARVKVSAGDLVQIDEVHSGRGYQSHFGSRLHFGLGQHERVERVEVRWIGGGVDVFDKLEVDRLVVLTEGAGVTGPKQRDGQ